MLVGARQDNDRDTRRFRPPGQYFGYRTVGQGQSGQHDIGLDLTEEPAIIPKRAGDVTVGGTSLAFKDAPDGSGVGLFVFRNQDPQVHQFRMNLKFASRIGRKVTTAGRPRDPLEGKNSPDRNSNRRSKPEDLYVRESYYPTTPNLVSG